MSNCWAKVKNTLNVYKTERRNQVEMIKITAATKKQQFRIITIIICRIHMREFVCVMSKSTKIYFSLSSIRNKNQEKNKHLNRRVHMEK